MKASTNTDASIGRVGTRRPTNTISAIPAAAKAMPVAIGTTATPNWPAATAMATAATTKATMSAITMTRECRVIVAVPESRRCTR